MRRKSKQDGKDLWVAMEGKSQEELVESPTVEKDAAHLKWVLGLQDTGLKYEYKLPRIMKSNGSVE